MGVGMKVLLEIGGYSNSTFAIDVDIAVSIAMALFSNGVSYKDNDVFEERDFDVNIKFCKMILPVIPVLPEQVPDPINDI
jgi:hypothetical protein